MSEAAFAEAAEAAALEEAEGLEPEANEDEGSETEAKAVDWEKKFHDAKGQAAKERSRRQTEATARRELEARLEKLEAAGKGSADPLEELAAQLRDDDEDPIHDITNVKAIIKKFLADQKAEREGQSQQSAQQRQTNALVSQMSDYEADFATDHPDYMEAAKYYRSEREAELEELGYSGQQLKTKLAQDLFGIVQTAIKAGKDPAEATYNLAKKRGFKGGETNDKLAKIGAASASVRPGSNGGRGSGALTWGAVANMKGAERDAAFAKLREQERKAG